MSADAVDDGATLAAPPGSAFHYASLYLPATGRHAVNVLEACRLEIARIPQSCSDRGVAHVKLAWWRDEIERLNDAAPRHAITRALATLALRDAALKPVCLAFVDAVACTLRDPVLPTDAAILDAVRAQHGGLFAAMSRHAGTGVSDEDPQALELACLSEVAFELGAFRQHRRAGLLYVAAGNLAAHGLDGDRARTTGDGGQVHQLVEPAIRATLERLEHAERGLAAGVRRRQRLFVILARIARRTLKLTLEDGCRVLERRVEPTPLHKLWIAWRTRTFG